MAKVLVTGASGFIGSHLVSALLARGDEVTCLVRATSLVQRLDALGARFSQGDVTQPESLSAAVRDKDVVYHLAGMTSALARRDYFRVNFEGTRNIAQACAAQPEPPVLLIVSSLAAAGLAVEGRPRIESDPPAPVSIYGRSKRDGEQAAEALADRVPTTIVRPPIVIGEGDRNALKMFNSIYKCGTHFLPGLVERWYSLIHADDLAELIILAAQRGRRLAPPGSAGSVSGQGYYFAACEEDVAYGHLGQLIGESLGRERVRLVRIAEPLVWVLGGVMEVVAQIQRRPRPMNIDKAREIVAGSWLCSARKAAEDLGFVVKAPLIERLRQTAQWYISEGWF
jgi:dihydroflavonol-4-reductase